MFSAFLDLVDLVYGAQVIRIDSESIKRIGRQRQHKTFFDLFCGVGDQGTFRFVGVDFKDLGLHPYSSFRQDLLAPTPPADAFRASTRRLPLADLEICDQLLCPSRSLSAKTNAHRNARSSQVGHKSAE